MISKSELETAKYNLRRIKTMAALLQNSELVKEWLVNASWLVNKIRVVACVTNDILEQKASTCKAHCLAPHLSRLSTLTLSMKYTGSIVGHELLMDERDKPPEGCACSLFPLPEPSQLLSRWPVLPEPHAHSDMPEQMSI